MAFQEVVGHRRLLSLLSQAIARDSLTPSLILSGPEGVGKRLTAVAVAQTLNCANTQTPRGVMRDSRLDESASGGPILDACGTCPTCRRIVRGAHADVQIVEPGDNGSIKIEQVRAAIDRAVYRPFEGRRRVTIIDRADALVPAAQNALLKTLEEPLPASVFILVTSRPDALLPTVRSRCAQLRFGRLNVADVALVLERHHGYPHADALTAAAASGGSVQHALELQADDFAQARGDAEDLLGVVGRDPRARLDQAKELLKGGGSAASEREHLEARLEALSSVLRDVGLLTSGADARLLANLDRRAALDALARMLGAERVERIFASVTRAHDALDRNVSPKVIADWLAVNAH
ncbi:MAG TPA: DNA polymerase III subunit [Vicinamibacterales bacterium]|nr:DNA polymerase III subunit [Vicinamibacterales bacterium]